MKEINVDKIKYIKKPKTDVQFGVPIKGRGRLGSDNIYIPEEKKAKPEASEEAKEQVAAEAQAECTDTPEEQAEEKALSIAEESGAVVPSKSKKERKSLKVKVRETKALFRVEEESRVVSVNTASKKKRPSFSTVMTVVFSLVLMMFMAINYVQQFENEKMINELRDSLDESRKLERKLTAELEQKYDLSEIGDYASSELGMVGSENSQKVYIDIGEEESVEVYEPETEDYGTIVTIMNALGDTFKAWIDVFG